MICNIYFIWFLLFSLLMFLISLKFMILNYSLILEYDVLSFNSLIIEMVIFLDWMSLLFISFVLFISSMVLLYSKEYMSMEKFLNRFIILIVLFVLSMMLLIISPNLISILLGWDGLGLVSYCLVIYYQNIKSYNAGMLTALTNRIGDVALLMAIAWMLNYGSWNYIFYLDLMKNDFEMNLISYLVVLAAMTKSAQIPFSSWLPAAMAAPTPVSSLVHSSTLVTAGVYLLIRFHVCLSENLKVYLLIFSCLTMFMSGLGANFEFDLKKIIALSTLSQLGLMMSILCVGDFKLAFFHLLTHALFKALLFMCAGMIIHNLNNCQDIRYMGSLINLMPLTCVYFNISNFSLCGIPFLSGFYSKDLIVEILSMQYLNLFVYVIFYFSVGLTVCYSFRLSYYFMIGDYNFNVVSMLNESKIMLKGMSGLIFFVIIMGSMMMWFMFSIPVMICMDLFMKLLTLLMILLGIYIGIEFSKFKIYYKLKSKNFYFSYFFASMWNMPLLSTLGLNWSVLEFGNVYKNMDYKWVEIYSGRGTMFLILMLMQNLQKLFKNYLKIYFLMMIIWLIILFIF